MPHYPILSLFRCQFVELQNCSVLEQQQQQPTNIETILWLQNSTTAPNISMTMQFNNPHHREHSKFAHNSTENTQHQPRERIFWQTRCQRASRSMIGTQWHMSVACDHRNPAWLICRIIHKQILLIQYLWMLMAIPEYYGSYDLSWYIWSYYCNGST